MLERIFPSCRHYLLWIYKNLYKEKKTFISQLKQYKSKKSRYGMAYFLTIMGKRKGMFVYFQGFVSGHQNYVNLTLSIQKHTTDSTILLFMNKK